MTQVKIFKSVENELSSMEKEINAWIQEHKARVLTVTGNISPQNGGTDGFSASDVLIILLYETES